MSLGIKVEDIVKNKFVDYFNSLDKEEAESKLKEYVDSSKEVLQANLDEANIYLKSIEDSCNSISLQVPIIITQMGSIVGILDPVAKATQLTTIKSQVSDLKVQMNTIFSQFNTLKKLVYQFGIGTEIIDSIYNIISVTNNLINTIPV